MDERRKKRGWAFWFAVAMLPPVMYVASFGPACWLCDAGRLPIAVVAGFYRPLLVTTFDGPAWASDMVEAYAYLLARPEYGIPVAPGATQRCGIIPDLRRNVRR